MLEWEQLFSREIYDEGAVVRVGNFPGGNFPLKQLFGEQFSLGEIGLEQYSMNFMKFPRTATFYFIHHIL